MSKGFSLNDYKDVAERIQEFYDTYPDGRLATGSPPQVVLIGDRPFVWYHAQAFRSPDDPIPGDGWAAEPVPGATPYTKDSELMNAETAAWGRAIVALGIATKKIASAQEVRGRQGDAAVDRPLRGGAAGAETSPAHRGGAAGAAKPAADPAITEAQTIVLKDLLPKVARIQGQTPIEVGDAWRNSYGVSGLIDLSEAQADELIGKATRLVKNAAEKATA